MKKFFRRTSLLLAAAFLGAATMQAQKSPQDMDRFIDALIKRMTVEEKIGPVKSLPDKPRTAMLPRRLSAGSSEAFST